MKGLAMLPPMLFIAVPMSLWLKAWICIPAALHPSCESLRILTLSGPSFTCCSEEQVV